MNSIRNMSMQDAFGILKGGDHAATDYLKRTSYDALVGLYRPKIQGSFTALLKRVFSKQ